MTLKLKPQGELEMGLTHIPVELRNFGTEDGITLRFLVDTGAMTSMAPANLLKNLGIKPVGKNTYELANGELVEIEHGNVEMRFLNQIVPAQILFVLIAPSHFWE
jgi:Aspartyl protease